MLLNPREIFDMVVMVAAVGYIFMDVFKDARPQDHFEFSTGMFNWKNFKFAAAVVAPAIILHEFGHKFAAILFGMHAQFTAAYFWLFLGIALKLMGVGFIFFVPAYVAWGCGTIACVQTLAANPWIGTIIAFMGPAINLVLWQGTKWYLKHKKVKKKYVPYLILTERINMFLFFFNLIPIPPFDGFSVVKGLWSTFF